MAIAFRYSAELPPLRTEADGAIWVGQSRVPLETVIDAFNAGSTPEDIVQDFSSLSLSDTYAVISYYLRHKQAVDSYIQLREAEVQFLANTFRQSSRATNCEIASWKERAPEAFVDSASPCRRELPWGYRPRFASAH